MQELLGHLGAALSTGSIYACLALALSVVYRSTGHINFAQGEMATVATYVAWSLLAAGVPYWPAFALTLAFAFAGGWGIEVGVIRPLKSHGHLALAAALLGIFIICNSTVGLIWLYDVRTFPSPFGDAFTSPLPYFSPHAAGVLVITGLTMAAVYVFFRYTRIGLAMRATVDNPLSSRLSGISIGFMSSLGWALASVIGAIAGMMIAPTVFLDPNMMTGVLLYGLAGALLGGIDNAWGAALGGFLIAIVETLLGAYVVGTDLRMSVAFAILVIALILRPAGLFGHRIQTKV